MTPVRMPRHNQSGPDPKRQGIALVGLIVVLLLLIFGLAYMMKPY
jgi:hypothetical protein